MLKMRIYELAKNLNISSKEIIETLSAFNIKAKNHMSSIDDNSIKIITEYYSKDEKKDKEENLLIKEYKENTQVEELEIKDMPIVKITQKITVKDFGDKIKKPSVDIIKKLMSIGIMSNINQDIDFNTATEIALMYDILLELEEEEDILKKEFFQEEQLDELKIERPPVVVVMGHVDHGKTSLLDYIRKSKVTNTEKGGITQHIGAYTVEASGKTITFLDTPGHEAFTTMRARGTKITDIAILVVAADDGIMPQTVEAINHAKAADIEIIVAINKIDKPNINIDKIKQELTEFDLLSEDWGGTTICVPVSALTGEGVDNLLEMILLSAEIKELKANYDKSARGVVIDSSLDKSRGSVATVLVQEGTLNLGDPVVIGSSYGRIRAMVDDKGAKIKKALPSTPVEILGMSEVPSAGDIFYVAKNDKHARQMSELVVAKGRKDMIKVALQKVSLDDLFNQIQIGNIKDLNIVIKADVHGSVEAVKDALEKLSNEEVNIRVIHYGVGNITETDVMLASASNAIIIGFNVKTQPSAISIAEQEKVDIRLYGIIYNAIEDIRLAINGLMDVILEEKVIGHAEIRQIFKSSGVGTIGGSYMTDGKITRNSKVRIIRDKEVSYEGTVNALKRFKDDVKEVAKGFEFGISFNDFNAIKEGDIVEAYIMEEVKR